MSQYNPPQFPTPGPPAAGPVGALSSDTGKKGRKSRRDSGTGGSGDGVQGPAKKVVDRQLKLAGIFALVVAVIVGLSVVGSGGGTYVVQVTRAVGVNSEVSTTSLNAVKVDPAVVVDGALSASSSKDVLGKVADLLKKSPRATRSIAKGEQVTPSMFGSALDLADKVDPDQRLLSVEIPISRAVGGQVEAGSSVDIIGTANDVTGVLATAVKVMSVTVSESAYQHIADLQSSDTKAKPSDLLPATPVPGIYLLRVSADEAARIQAVADNGTLTLVYRPADSTDMPADTMTAHQAVCALSPTSSSCSGS